MLSTVRLGIDLGGTKIEGIALDGSREVARIRIATPRDDYAATLDAIAAVVAALERDAGARGSVGIGIPGTLSPATGLVKNANSVWLIGRPLHADVQQRLGRAVRIANDANCFAVSEAADGAAAGAGVVVGVIVGTGTGAGIVVHGRVLAGANAIAGEWGHNPLPWPEDDERPGPACYCGHHGCIETFLSGPGFEQDFERRAGRRDSARQIVAAATASAGSQPSPARHGDDAAETLARYEHRMARALAGVINVLDPDVIVLGGGMSNIDRLYETIPTIWRDYVFAAFRSDPRRDTASPPGAAAAVTADAGPTPAPSGSAAWPPVAAAHVGAGRVANSADVSGVPADEPRAPDVERVRTRLVRAAHGDASGVRGAAWLWPLEQG